MKRYETILGMAVLACLCIGLLTGCRSSRSAVSDATRVEHSGSHIVERSDSTSTGVSTRKEHADTADLRADDGGSVEIRRDSVGRPIFIVWNRSLRMAYGSAGFSRSAETIQWRGASTAAIRTDTVDTVSSATEETTTEIDATLPLRPLTIAGLIIIGLSIGLWIWKRSR